MKTTDNTTNINQTYEQLKVRNEALADLEHANLANIINRMSDHLETVIAQRDTALAALRDLVDVNERIGAPAITQGGLCEEQDWTHGMRQARAVIAASQGGAQ